MEKWIDGVLADACPPERPKFKSPMILVHGLWSGSWSWQSWSTHFSNLGWECWAVNLRGRFEQNAQKVLKRLNFQDCLVDLKRVIHTASFPPVLVGHCLGGLIAQKACEAEKVSALILLSTLPPSEIQTVVPRALQLLRVKYAPLIYLRRAFRLEERDLRRNWLASLHESQQAQVLKRMVPDSSYLIKELFRCRINIDFKRIRCPVLVVGGSEDRVVPADSLREVAQGLGADLKVYSNHGHWMMGEEGGETIVRDIHRWVVQKMGEEILVADLPEHP